jgi:hypothetical protein
LKEEKAELQLHDSQSALGDEVRNNGGFAVDLERSGAGFCLPVCYGYALVLAQMLGPGLDDESFKEPPRVGCIMK